MHEQKQEDVASTLASPGTPQQPARQVPVGSGTGKGGWVWITGSGQQRQLAARRLTRAPWLASVPSSAARSLSLWTSDPCDAVVVRWRGEGSKGKSMRVRVREGSEPRGCDGKAAVRGPLGLESLGLGPSQIEIRCDVSTSGQVAESSRPMWVCGCDVECQACVLHGGSDLDREAQRGGAVPCWSSRRGAGESKKDREPQS